MELEFWIGVRNHEGLIEGTFLFDTREKAEKWIESAKDGDVHDVSYHKYELDDDDIKQYAQDNLDMRHVDGDRPLGG